MAQREDLRKKLYGLARAERDVRRRIGKRVLAGDSTVDLRALRREIRESQDDISSAIIQLDAQTQ